MAKVRAANLVVKEIEDAIVSVNGGEGTSHPGPLIFTIGRDRWIRVMKKGVHKSPKVKQTNGKPIKQCNGQSTVFKTELDQEPNSEKNSGHREIGLRPKLGGEEA